MAFLDDMASVLVGAGVGVINVNIFLSSKAIIPNGPGPYLTLSETGGSGPTRIQNQTSAATQRPTGQIAVRGLSYSLARSMIGEAYSALDGLFNATLNGVFYLSVTARQEPTDTGVLDGAGRVVLVFNISAEKYAS